MTDLEKLQSALHTTTPRPDSNAKAETLRLAAENFARLQENEAPARPISEAPQTGSLWKRTKAMFTFKTLRPVFYTTSCIAVAGLAYSIYDPLETAPAGSALPESTIASAPSPAKETAVQTDRTADETAQEPMPEVADARPKQLSKSATAQPVPAEGIMLSGSGRVGLSGQEANQADQDGSNTSGLASDDRIRLQTFTSEPTEQTVPENGRARLKSSRVTLENTLESERPATAAHTGADQFTATAENPVKVTAEFPTSTFSIDVDTASYAYVRSTLLNGGQLNKDAVRIEEMVNYFTYDYAAPTVASDIPFSTQIDVLQTPWNPDTRLVQIGIQGKKPAIKDRPPLNLVFLIDTSGSMQNAQKLPLLKQSFALMLTQLRPTDEVAIITYAGRAGTVLEPTKAAQTATILNALDGLEAGGATAGGAGLRAAYALAEQMKETHEISRVLLATDGDFNVGIQTPDALKALVEQNRDSGTYLSVLGFGRGTYRDDMMQTLAQNGNGTAAYIDTLAEAQKALVDQLSGALFPIANDVKIQVEFNPATIAEYRLIGYETRALKREDFNNDRVDAGDIGAGHQVTALYEVTPVGSPAILNDTLRYGANAKPANRSELGFFKLRYKNPNASESQRITTPIQLEKTPSKANFATAIAGFAQTLKGSNYLGTWSIKDAIELAENTKGPDPFGYRAEAIRLMKIAQARQ